MTSPTPVSSVAGFTIDAQGLPFIPVVPLYRLVNEVPERLEAVYMTLVYPDDPSEVTNDCYAVQLVDQSGKTLIEIPSPVIAGSVHVPMSVKLGWSRLGEDSAQNGIATYTTTGTETTVMWTNMRLPDFVLVPGSTVNLVAYRDGGNEETVLTVTDAVVVTTPFPGVVTNVTAVDILPLLVPTATG